MRRISAAARRRSDGARRRSAGVRRVSDGPRRLSDGVRRLSDGLRRALLGLSDCAESYGAASIAGLATKMARAPLANSSERAAVQGLAHLLMDRERSDQELAAKVKDASIAWAGAPPVEAPQIVPIESLLYRGHSAVTRARTVRDQLKVHWSRGTLAEPSAHALFEELSDLLDLAGTT